MSEVSFNNTIHSQDITLHDDGTKERYEAWINGSKLLHIRAITALTAVLYLVATITDHIIAPPEILKTMTLFHLYLLPPFLLLISLLTFKSRFNTLILILLMLVPIIATIGNLMVTTTLQHPSMRLTEVYLIIFWVFTISGLRLWPATISAGIITMTLFTMFFFYFSLSLEDLVMNSFWLLSSFSFGFLGAYLLERSYQTIFIHQEQLKLLAETDNLTGLFNRSKLDVMLQTELKRSQRYKTPFGLILIDFDYFKQINDNYGHQAGDTALIEIAKLIKEHLRSNDIAVRWGGEEFIIIYLNVGKEQLLQLSHEIHQKIQRHTFKDMKEQTASIGVTLFQKDDTASSIIQRADQALYLAKKSGRNRVEFI